MAKDRGDSADEFFHEIVEPTVGEFLSARSDRRRASLACLALASLADHYFHAREPLPHDFRDANNFRKRLGSEHWGYGQIVAIANAVKHFAPQAGRVGFDDITSRQIHFGNLRFGWPINGTEVMVEVGPDNLWLVSQLAEASMKFWRDKLAGKASE